MSHCNGGHEQPVSKPGEIRLACYIKDCQEHICHCSLCENNAEVLAESSVDGHDAAHWKRAAETLHAEVVRLTDLLEKKPL